MRRVIEAIGKSKAPLVVHNGLQDLAYIYHHFYKALPDDVVAFKQSLHELFPQIYDTKLIADNAPVRANVNSTALEELCSDLERPPFSSVCISVENGVCFDGDKGKLHEAAYDAYLTGKAYVLMSVFLKAKGLEQQEQRESHDEDNDDAHTGNNEESSKLDSNETQEECGTISIEKAFVNKVFIMRSAYTYFDIEKPEPEIDRTCHFHASFPAKWRTSDLKQALSPAVGDVIVRWLTDTTAIVELRDESKLDYMRAFKHVDVTTITYDAYRENQAAAKETSVSVAGANKRKNGDDGVNGGPQKQLRAC